MPRPTARAATARGETLAGDEVVRRRLPGRFLIAAARGLAGAAAAAGAAWGLGAAWLAPWAGAPWRAAATVALASAFAVALRSLARARRAAAAAVVLALGLGTGLLLRGLVHASHDRDWEPAQSRMPRAEVRGELVTIRGLRDFRYGPDGVPRPAWSDRSYDLSRLRAVWLAVSPFSSIPGVGHVFVSFDFTDDFLAVSVEARRERGERYSPLRGIYGAYETIYVLGTEADVLALRVDVWKDTVYLYPVRTTPARAREALLSILARVDRLADEPELYDTAFNSCASNLARHVNEVVPGRVPMTSARLLLAGFSDELALELGLIDGSGDIAEVRERFRVPPGRADPAEPGYSLRLRGLWQPE